MRGRSVLSPRARRPVCRHFWPDYCGDYCDQHHYAQGRQVDLLALLRLRPPWLRPHGRPEQPGHRPRDGHGGRDWRAGLGQAAQAVHRHGPHLVLRLRARCAPRPSWPLPDIRLLQSFVHVRILPFLPLPICIAHSNAILLHDDCAIYDSPPTPLVYAIHHTQLVLAISCKGTSVSPSAPPYRVGLSPPRYHLPLRTAALALPRFPVCRQVCTV